MIVALSMSADVFVSDAPDKIHQMLIKEYFLERVVL